MTVGKSPTAPHELQLRKALSPLTPINVCPRRASPKAGLGPAQSGRGVQYTVSVPDCVPACGLPARSCASTRMR